MRLLTMITDQISLLVTIILQQAQLFCFGLFINSCSVISSANWPG